MRNVRVLQAVLAHYLGRGWLLPTMYLPPGATRGCAGAASKEHGGLGVPHAPSPALAGWCSVGFTLRCSLQFKVFMPPSEKKSSGDPWHWESCACRRKVSFQAMCRLFLYPLPPSSRLY